MLPWIIVGLLTGGGVGAGAYLAFRRRSPGFAGIPEQSMLDDQVSEEIAAETLVTIGATKLLEPIRATKMLEEIGATRILETISAKVEAEKAKHPPREKINKANGWEPLWLHKAEKAKLEWGFCLWDLKEAQTNAEMYDESKFAKLAASLIGRAVQWVIDFVKKKTIDISFCTRIELPAVRIELSDGRSFWMPSEPEGGLPTDIQGWNPYGRPGFSVSLGKWPLSKNPPPGDIGALWIRPFGDLWGWAKFDQPVEVYQIVVSQNGILKSFPAMSRRDWRIALMLGGQTPSGGEIYPGGVAKWFKDWRLSGQPYKMRPASRKRAMEMFEK